ncbi:hypothetical protein BHM03_00053755 [Ensete ventricosum]|nr:hypothetical protein BHM03_00053755 [Ensete ventricosum]
MILLTRAFAICAEITKASSWSVTIRLFLLLEGKCSTLRFVKSTKEGEPVHQDAPGSYYSPGALATLGPPSSAKNVGEFDTMAEELARLGSAHVYKLVCVGPLWGALHKVLVKVGPSDLAPPTIKLVTQAI